MTATMTATTRAAYGEAQRLAAERIAEAAAARKNRNAPTDDGCRLWPHLDTTGAPGMIRTADGRRRRAHVAIAEAFLGPKPTAGHVVAQRCGQPACIALAHLSYLVPSGAALVASHGSKRAAGTGSIRPLGPRKWRVFVAVAGAKRSRTVYGTRATAEAELVKLRQEPARQPARVEVPTFAEAAERYFTARALKASTIGTHRRTLRLYLDPISAKPLDQITGPDIAVILDGMTGRGLGRGTVEGVWSLTSSIFGQAVRSGLLDRSPMARLDKPRARAKIIELPARSEVDRIVQHVAAADPDGWWSLFVLAASLTGARRSELAALKVRDLNAPRVEIRRAVNPAGEVTTPKSGRGRVVEVIDRQFWHLVAKRTDGLDLDAYLFSSDNGRSPMSAHTIGSRWTRTIADLGLSGRGIGLHTLRRAAATYSHQAGASLRAVQTVMGHASIATTARYLFATDDDAASVAAALSAGRPTIAAQQPAHQAQQVQQVQQVTEVAEVAERPAQPPEVTALDVLDVDAFTFGDDTDDDLDALTIGDRR
jgi:integrase